MEGVTRVEFTILILQTVNWNPHSRDVFENLLCYQPSVIKGDK
jgi:hypothetical protein